MRCFPQNYVEMNDKEYENACERGLGRIKQQRSKLGRAQTFAFGQRYQPKPIEESPTASNQLCHDTMMGMDLSMSQPIDSKLRLHSRRMASY